MIYSWSNVINVSLTTEFLLFLVCCVISVFIHEARIISFAEQGMSCVLMCCSIKGMQVALVLGTVDVCYLSLLIVDVDC